MMLAYPLLDPWQQVFFSYLVVHGFGRIEFVSSRFANVKCGVLPLTTFARYVVQLLRLVRFALLPAVSSVALAQIEFLPASAPQAVFGGEPASVQVTLRNRGAATALIDFSTRLLQLSSATVLPLGGPQPRKPIESVAGQTIVETVSVTVPEVHSPTLFQLEILAGGKSVARYPVFACPRDLLQQVGAIAGAKPLGILDPAGKLRPLLDQTRASFVEIDLGDRQPSDDCPLVILGPFSSPGEVPANLVARANALAKRNVGVVALLPHGALGGLSAGGLSPLAMVSPDGPRACVVLCEVGADEFGESAASQLGLFRMAQLALGIRPAFREGGLRP